MNTFVNKTLKKIYSMLMAVISYASNQKVSLEKQPDVSSGHASRLVFLGIWGADCLRFSWSAIICNNQCCAGGGPGPARFFVAPSNILAQFWIEGFHRWRPQEFLRLSAKFSLTYYHLWPRVKLSFIVKVTHKNTARNVISLVSAL